MAKKNKTKEQARTVVTPTPAAKKTFTFNSQRFFTLAGCLLYFVVHFIPDLGAYDAMGPQWIYMVVLDLAIIIFLLARKDDYRLSAARVFNNSFSKLYLAFFVLAGISVFVAINPTEGWVCYVRLIATVIAYFNMVILFEGRIDLFKILAQVLAIVLFVEACQTISQFVNGLSDVGSSDTGLTLLIMSLKGTAGNKNIFAAGLVIKIPFVIYCIHRSRLLGKVLNFLILSLAAVATFLINARASYLSLLLTLVLYIAFCLLTYLREKELEKNLFRIGSVLVPLVIAFFVSQMMLSHAESLQDDKAGKDFGSVTERLASVAQTSDESNQVRFRLWQHAIDYTRHNPLMGCGIGNWKIASIPYQRTITNDLYVPIHAHNDFLEVFAELGIPGGLLYLGLFVCLAVFTIKTYFSNADGETKLIAVFSLLSLISYAVDAMFNFPLERPISQVFFAFIVAVNVGAFIKGREELGDEKVVMQKVGNAKLLYVFVSILLLIPSFYVTWLTYKSLIVQKTVLGDLNNEPLKMDYKEVLPSFPSIPNLSATAQPIEAIKGRYLYEAGKFDEALVLLNKGRKANPVIGYSEFLKAGLYYKQNKLDSAVRNGMVAFYTRPKAKTYYQTLVAILAKMKDTTNLKKVFAEYDRYRHHAYGWDMFLRGMLNAEIGMGKVMPNLATYVDSGLRAFPGDSELLVRKKEITDNVAASMASKTSIANQAEAIKYFTAATTAYNAGALQKAADLFLKSYSLNPGNFYALENAAMCYFNLNQFKKSLVYFDQELALKVSASGKPEFYKGVALLNLGKPDGCSFLKLSKAKGFKDKEAELTAILKSRCGQ